MTEVAAAVAVEAVVAVVVPGRRRRRPAVPAAVAAARVHLTKTLSGRPPAFARYDNSPPQRVQSRRRRLLELLLQVLGNHLQAARSSLKSLAELKAVSGLVAGVLLWVLQVNGSSPGPAGGEVATDASGRSSRSAVLSSSASASSSSAATAHAAYGGTGEGDPALGPGVAAAIESLGMGTVVANSRRAKAAGVGGGLGAGAVTGPLGGAGQVQQGGRQGLTTKPRFYAQIFAPASAGGFRFVDLEYRRMLTAADKQRQKLRHANCTGSGAHGGANVSSPVQRLRVVFIRLFKAVYTQQEQEQEHINKPPPRERGGGGPIAGAGEPRFAFVVEAAAAAGGSRSRSPGHAGRRRRGPQEDAVWACPTAGPRW
jgi:hypothetical protein